MLRPDAAQRHRGHRHARPTSLGLRVGGKTGTAHQAGQRPLRRARTREPRLLRRGLPHRRAARRRPLLRADHAGRAQADAGRQRLHHRRLHRRAGRRAGDRPHRAVPGRARASILPPDLGPSAAEPRRGRSERTSDERARLSELLRRDLAVDPEIAGVTADSRKVQAGLPVRRPAGRQGRRPRASSPAALAAGAAAVLGRRRRSTAGRAGGAAPATRAAPTPWPPPPSGARSRRPASRSPAPTARPRSPPSAARSSTACGRSVGQHGHAGRARRRRADHPARPDHARTPPTSPRLLADLAGRGVTHLALEASSHGIDQRRLDGVQLTAAGFLNLTQDHLDYHGTMERLPRRQAAPVRDPAAARRARRC